MVDDDGFRFSCSNVADWWRGFNASALRQRCSAEWRSGFADAREVERRLEAKATKGSEPYNPAFCINCFERIPTNKGPLALTCCTACQQIAEGVRGLRRWVAIPGNILNMDEISQRQRFTCCAVSKDGYNKRARSISSHLRESVFERAGYKCERCGRSPGNSPESMLTVQHMRSDSNDLADLKAYCHQCNTIDPLGFVASRQLAGYGTDELVKLNLVEVKHPDRLREPHVEVLMREIQLRVLTAAPQLPCDDPDLWPGRFREFQAMRRGYMKAISSESSGRGLGIATNVG